MNLPINATIACTDGPCGRSQAILLNPITDQITHIIVREPGLLGVERMVPVELVLDSTSDSIRLRSSKAALADLPPFVTTNYLPTSAGYRPGYEGGVMLWPYVSMAPAIGVDQENTPAGELAIHRGSHVHATDGHIGSVEQFVVNPASDNITHVVLQSGPLWNHQNTTIPISCIDHIEDDNVYLTLSKDQIAALPALLLRSAEVGH
jgi:hypothetical protein